jgi:hypothetical protein
MNMNDITVTAQQGIKVDRIGSVTEEAENAAMIMFIWIDDHRCEFMDASDLHQNDIGGFIGMTELAAQAGCVFAEETSDLIAGDDYCWYEAIAAFAFRVICHLSHAMIESAEMHRLAAASIEKNKQ